MNDATPDLPEEARALQRMIVSGELPSALPEWDVLLAYAREHNVTPLLRKKLAGQPAIPDAICQRMQREYMRSAARAALLQRDLAGLLANLNRAGVDVLLLKGSALAAAIYPDPALRPMVDVDVLIRPEDVPRVMELAGEMGYTPQHAQTRAGDDLEFENEIAMIKPASAMSMVEFHWSLFNSPHHQNKMQMDWFFQTAVPITLNKTPAKMLGAEAQLLHLSSHLMLHHRGYGLLWWNDIAELLQKFAGSLNWQLVLQKAHEFDLVLPLKDVVLRLHKEWGAPVPPGVVDGLRGEQATPREAQVYDWLTAPQRPVAQRFAADLRALPSWRARAKFGLNNLFPSAHYMRNRYRLKSGLLLPLAYPYRWALGLMSAVRRGKETGNKK